MDIGANTDDGSCIPYIYGCMNVLADNYDALANTDDESCFFTYGCTDSNYVEYFTQGFIPLEDDGSCVNIAIYGCLVDGFANYNPDANMADECIHIFGCTDTIACNFDV